MIRFSVCTTCKHLNKKRGCKAFPEGIPKKIILGEIKHDKPLKDQKNDIVYEEKK